MTSELRESKMIMNTMNDLTEMDEMDNFQTDTKWQNRLKKKQRSEQTYEKQGD